jgi:large subunit ribosomal protein L24
MAGRFPIRKGDQIEVLSGKERGKRGKVVTVDRKHERATVEKLNFHTRHLKPGHPIAPQGGRVERESPIDLTNLMLVCPKCQKRTRPSTKRLESGTRIRVCRQCDEHID